MLTFLRKIRRSLIESGSTRRYLLYAIGEIALVVIGILIALQINTWNEQRKKRITEREILIGLQENLELNVNKLNEEIERKHRSDFSSQVILNAIEKKLPYHDTMSWHFGWALSWEDPGPLSRAGYESFKNIGTDILRNKDLKKEIVYLFEDTYALSSTRMTRLMELNVETVKLRQQYLMRQESFNFKPFDYQSLIRDKQFHSWGKSIRNSRAWGRNAMEESLEETMRVLRLVNDELTF